METVLTGQRSRRALPSAGKSGRPLRAGRHLLALPTGILLLFCFLVPVIWLFSIALFDPVFSTEHFERLYNSRAYSTVFYNSVSVATTVTLICLLLGYPFAAFLTFLPENRRTPWLFLALIPMWMSILIRSYAWMVVLGREGIVNDLIQWAGLASEPVKLLHTSGAVYVGMVQILAPLMIITCFAGMTTIDLTLVRAARVLGASPRRAFFGTFFPLSLSGVVSGSVVVFILSLGFFVTPALLGGRRDIMVANLISIMVEHNNWGFAATVAIVLLALTLGILAGFYALAALAKRVGGS